MKATELRKLYISVTRLYGVITSKDLFTLLDHYHVPYKEEQILKDLDNRSMREPKDFAIYSRLTHFLICDEIYEDKEIKIILKLKEGKPFYYPNTYEDLLKYSDYSYNDENDEKAYNTLNNFLKENIKAEPYKITCLTSMILDKFKYTLSNNSFDHVFKCFDNLLMDIPNEKVILELFKVLQEIANNLRMIYNNGYTPEELFELEEAPVDMNNVFMSIGPNMIKNFKNRSLDPSYFLDEVEASDLPPVIKTELRQELKEIIEKLHITPDA